MALIVTGDKLGHFIAAHAGLQFAEQRLRERHSAVMLLTALS